MLYPENTKPTWDCKFLFLRVLCIIVTKLKLNSMYGLYCIFYFGIVWTDTIMHISELMDHWGSWHTVVVSANTVTATIFAGLCQAACTLTTRGHLISTDAIYRTSCIFFFCWIQGRLQLDEVERRDDWQLPQWLQRYKVCVYIGPSWTYVSMH